MSAIYSCLMFKDQPGSTPGLNATGCISGATKLEMWQPTDTWKHEGSGAFMLHCEDGVNISLTTKASRFRAWDTIHALSNEMYTEFPNVTQWYYTPRFIRDPWYSASLGDKSSQQEVKQWRSSLADDISLGIPGEHVHGVCIDLYDFHYMRSVWHTRVMENAAPWLSRGVPVLPIVYLKWMDTKVSYTEGETRERIGFLLNAFGRCAVFDEGLDAHGQLMTYSDWSLGPVVESLARGE